MINIKEFTKLNADIEKVNFRLSTIFFSIFIVIMYGYFGLVVNTPLILADEAGYISNAKYFATGAGLIDLRFFIYYPGISFFYTPIFYFTDDLSTAFKFMQLINLSFAIVIPLIGYKIFLNIYKHKNLEIYLISIFSFLYSSVFCYINLALPEILLTLLFLADIYILQKYIETKKILYIFLLSIVSLLSLLSHPRAVVIIIAINMTFLIFINKNKKHLFVMITVSIFTYFLSSELIESLQHAYISIMLDDRDIINNKSMSLSKLIFKNFNTTDSFKELLLEIYGQLWYLTISSFGLIWFGLYSLIKNIFTDKHREISIFIVLSALGILALSSMFMNGQLRGDHMIYGRYNEFIWLSVMLFGLYEIFNSKSKRNIIKLFILILVFIYPLLVEDLVQNRTYNHNNILGLYFYNILFNGYSLVKISNLFIIMIIFIYCVVLKKRNNKFIFSFVIFLLLVFNNFLILNKYYKADSDGRTLERELTYQINQFANKNTIIGYDRTTWSPWHFFNYQLFANINMYRFDSKKNIAKHSFSFIISGRKSLGDNYRIVGLENHHKQKLFVNKNTRFYNKIVDSGHILPKDFPCSLPIESFKYKFIKTSLEKGKLTIQLQHIGQKSFWPNLYGVQNGQYSVRLGLQYLDINMKKISEERIEFKKSIYPNDTYKDTFNLLEQCKSQYVKIDLVQDGVAWFESYGNEPILLKCENNKYKLIKEIPE